MAQRNGLSPPPRRPRSQQNDVIRNRAWRSVRGRVWHQRVVAARPGAGCDTEDLGRAGIASPRDRWSVLSERDTVRLADDVT